MISRNKTFTFAALAVIVAMSTVLHFWRISYPSQPLFDEVHFATYAADYVQHRAYYDIHPPLGKLVYAAVLSFAMPRNFSGTSQFVIIKMNQETKNLDVTDAGVPFGDFPYVPLRATSAVVGVLLVLAFYKFLRALGLSTIGSLLGAFFVTFENALLLDTRLILLNSMFMAFGFLALAFYFQKNRRPWLAGALWGLALSVKLSAVVFLAPIFIVYCLARVKHVRAGALSASSPATRSKDNYALEKSYGKKFLVMGIIVLIFVSSFNLFVFSSQDRFYVLEFLGWNYTVPASSSIKTNMLAFAGASLVDVTLSISNYLKGSPHPLGSPWYMWPAMQIPMPFYEEGVGTGVKQIVLQGNYVVWFASTLAAALGLALLYRYLRGYLRRPFVGLARLTQAPAEQAREGGREDNSGTLRPFFILLGGYIGCMLPFFTVVHRSTFLYHYFPALMFAIGLLAWFLAHTLKLEDFDTLSKKQIFSLSLILVAVMGGFLWTAPVTYGL